MAEKVDFTDAQWRERMSDEQFHVCREHGTERPFTGKYWDCKVDGVYRCSACGEPLFSSETKYDSGSGWPSFYQPVDQQAVEAQV